jgi:hypothetical protein
MATMSELSNDQLDAIEARAKAATPGPWDVDNPDITIGLRDVLALIEALRESRAKNERAVEALRAFGVLGDDSEPDYEPPSQGGSVERE